MKNITYALLYTLILVSGNIYSQVDKFDSYELYGIKFLKIQTISEYKIFNLDSIKPDTITVTKYFFDSLGNITERRYNYHSNLSDFKCNNYDKTIYSYDINGKFLDSTRTITSFTCVLESPPPKLSECKYYNKSGNLIKCMIMRKYDLIYSSDYFYKNILLKDSEDESSYDLLIKIDNYCNGQLTSKNIYEYTYY